MIVSRPSHRVEADFTSCPKCSEAQLVEIFLGAPDTKGCGNAFAFCHFCGHQQQSTYKPASAPAEGHVSV